MTSLVTSSIGSLKETKQTQLSKPQQIFYLENIGQIAQIEHIVELDGGRQECLRDLLVQIQRTLHHVVGQLLQRRANADDLQMLRDDAVVDGVQGVGSRETQGEHGKVTLCVKDWKDHIMESIL